MGRFLVRTIAYCAQIWLRRRAPGRSRTPDTSRRRRPSREMNSLRTRENFPRRLRGRVSLVSSHVKYTWIRKSPGMWLTRLNNWTFLVRQINLEFFTSIVLSFAFLRNVEIFLLFHNMYARIPALIFEICLIIMHHQLHWILFDVATFRALIFAINMPIIKLHVIIYSKKCNTLEK